jgi:hypothetical protein
MDGWMARRGDRKRKEIWLNDDNFLFALALHIVSDRQEHRIAAAENENDWEWLGSHSREVCQSLMLFPLSSLIHTLNYGIV